MGNGEWGKKFKVNKGGEAGIRFAKISEDSWLIIIGGEAGEIIRGN